MHTNILQWFYILHRSETIKEVIKTDNGKVTDGNLTPTLMPKYTYLIAKPLDKDGKPIYRAKLNLKCGNPQRRYIGNVQPDGTYVFKNAIPLSGQEECTMNIEAPG